MTTNERKASRITEEIHTLYIKADTVEPLMSTDELMRRVRALDCQLDMLRPK